MAFSGNVQYVMSHAPDIASAIRAGVTTVTALLKHYHCGYDTLLKAILTQMTKTRYRRICRKRLAKSGVTWRFIKGHATWNKGLKGLSFPGSQATQFKKGHLPANHKQVGAIVVRNDKCGKPFHWIKVSGIRQGQHTWIPYARHLYSQSHGDVPDGYFVVHADGDTLNDDINNLRLVNHRDHLALQMARDPGMLKKRRRNAGRAAKRRHAANRKLKGRLSRQAITAQRQAAAEDHRRPQIEAAIAQLQGPMTEWWECIGCACDFPSQPPRACPKCCGLRFTQIRQRQRRNTA